MSALHCRRILLPALAALLLVPAVLPADAPPSDDDAIPVERIPAQLEASRELVRRAVELARPRADMEAIQQQVSGIEAQLEAIEAAPADAAARIDMRALESAREQLSSLRRNIGGWQSTLGRRAGELGDMRDALSEAMRAWRATEQQAAERDLPTELRQSIRNIRQALEDADRRVLERQDQVLRLQSVLTRWLSALDERQALVDSALAQARLNLFRADHPPLWQGVVGELDLEASREAWRSDWRLLANYLRGHQGNIGIHLGLLALVLGAFATLSRKVRHWVADKPNLEAPLRVFRHPLAAALILGILAGPWFYPGAPLFLRELSGVILVLPLLRVLQLVVTPSLRSALYLTAGLYLLMRLNSLLASGTVFDRYTLLVLSVAAAVTVAWIFRPGGAGAEFEAGRWWRLGRFAARLGLVLLGLAVVANIGGLVALSGLLTNAVISSAFAAIVLFAGIVVARATVLALMQTRLLQHVNLVRWHAAAVDEWILKVLPLVAFAAWLIYTARLFRIEGIAGDLLSRILFSSATIGTVQISLGDILGFGIAIWLGVLVSRFLRFVLNVDVFPRVTLPRGVAATISMLVNYLVLGIAFVLAVAAAGIQLDRFALIVGALSVGIGFGLQNIVNNFVSGLILAFERPVQSGDTVQFSDMFGKISRIGVRSSTVRTFDGAEVIVPNANLISNEVTNWTLSDYRRRIEILVGVAYGSNPHKVMELLLNCVRADERVMEDPAPNVIFLGFGDSSLDFSLRAWTEEFDSFLRIKSDLTLAVHDALYEAGIEIPFPQRDLHLRSVDPQAVARIGAVTAPPVGDGEVTPRAPEEGGSAPPGPAETRP